jgi:TolB-like protein
MLNCIYPRAIWQLSAASRPTSNHAMYRLKLLGGAALLDASGSVAGRSGQGYQLALLALLVSAGEKGVRRDRLVAYLWPESESAAARHRLSDTLYDLRRTLGEEAVIASGETLRASPCSIQVDVREFEEAVRGGDPAAAVRLYEGPFLDGFHLDSQDFESWLHVERRRLAGLYGGSLETLARGAEGAGHPAQAAEWWQRLLAEDPYRSPVVLSLLKSLVAAGDPAAAIRHADAHTRLLRGELDVDPPPELSALVRRIRGAGIPDDARSVAVLPFVNVGGDPDTEYFSDGVTYDIINRLAKIADLKVISGTSSARFKGTERPVRTIAAELGASTIIEGEVQQVAGRVRINVQLIDARTDEHLWADQYDRELGDVFAIQSDVARHVADGLRATLTAAEQERIGREPTEEIEAYTLYLRGRSHWVRRGAGLHTALDYFRRALEVDPEYALAHAGAADCHALFGWFGELPPKESFPKAKAAALQALEINPELAEARATLGFVRAFHDWNPGAAELELRRAIELEPGYAPAHYFLSPVLLVTDRRDEAIERSRLALELDPLSPFVNAHLGWMLIGAARPKEAIIQLERALELDPDLAMAHWLMGWARVYESGPVAGIPHLDSAVQRSGRTPWFLATLGFAYGVAGRPESADVLEELEAQTATRYVRPLAHVLVHIGRGETPQALDWLERAYAERDPWLAALKIDPAFDRLRSESRFVDLMDQVGLW